MKKTASCMRSLLLGVFASPAVFALTAFTVSGMFMTERLSQYRGLIELNVILPWGLALALLRLYRAREKRQPLRWDVCALAALFAWMVVGGVRFGEGCLIR